jgi:hypothetical protein
MQSERTRRRVQRAYSKFLVTDLRYRARLFQLVGPLRELQTCLLCAIRVAKQHRMLTVKMIAEGINQNNEHRVPDLKARLAEFPLVFTSAFAVSLLDSIHEDIDDEIRDIHRANPRTERDEAMRDWLAIRYD